MERCSGDVAVVEGTVVDWDVDGTCETDAKELLLDLACGDVADMPTRISCAESPEKRLLSTSP